MQSGGRTMKGFMSLTRCQKVTLISQTSLFSWRLEMEVQKWLLVLGLIIFLCTSTWVSVSSNIVLLFSAYLYTPNQNAFITYLFMMGLLSLFKFVCSFFSYIKNKKNWKRHNLIKKVFVWSRTITTVLMCRLIWRCKIWKVFYFLSK